MSNGCPNHFPALFVVNDESIRQLRTANPRAKRFFQNRLDFGIPVILQNGFKPSETLSPASAHPSRSSSNSSRGKSAIGCFRRIGIYTPIVDDTHGVQNSDWCTIIIDFNRCETC